jgi:hypothetical protein
MVKRTKRNSVLKNRIFLQSTYNPTKKPLHDEGAFLCNFLILKSVNWYLLSFQMAGRQGFEPWLTESESVVLPLDDLPKKKYQLNINFYVGQVKTFIFCNLKNGTCSQGAFTDVKIFHHPMVNNVILAKTHRRQVKILYNDNGFHVRN